MSDSDSQTQKQNGRMVSNQPDNQVPILILDISL